MHPPTQKNSSVSSETIATHNQLPQEGVEYHSDNIHNGWADLFERLSTSSGEGHAVFPQQHPNIDTSPDLDNSLLADITTSEAKGAINSLASNKAS